MTPRKPVYRFLLGAAVVLLAAVIGFAWTGAASLTWGSTPEERSRALPGDDLVASPQLLWNHALTIKAPAEAVYPWLVQMGDSRAAFYSFTFIENLFCAASGECRYVNADRVHPEWQTPEKGAQGIIMDYLVISDYQPGRYVLATAAEKLGLKWTWLWYVEPVNASTSRLIVRHRIAFPEGAPEGLIKAVFTTGFVMERGMMLGIQSRAEGRVPWAGEEPLGALIWLAVLVMGVVSGVRFVRVGDGYHPLGVGLEAVVVLFVLTYIQPPMLLRVVLLLMVASGMYITYRRSAARPVTAAAKA